MSSSPSKLYEEASEVKITVRPGMALERMSKEALTYPDKFWAEQARGLDWHRQWDSVLDWNPPFARWFSGGLLNASVNCLDRHVVAAGDTKNKAAIIWESESGESRTLTYFQLYRYVNKFANVLKGLGVQKGDRVTIYMPMVPELPVAMLACARIGATHSVVFSGFSSQALADRVKDARSKVIVTADGGLRKGKLIDLKKVVDESLVQTPFVEHVVVFPRAGNEVKMGPKDVWWHEVVEKAPTYCEPEMVESAHPLYILYTSGTTGKPKGVMHGTAGYLVYLYATAKWVFDFNKSDIFFCTADIGWVTGHSYMVYAPLMHGVTEIMYDGAPDYPRPDRYWAIAEKHGATILYTTPTALRMYMKYGDAVPNSFDLSSLRLLGTVGESINPQVWQWYFKTIGKERCPIIDTWWQTETGGIVLSACTGVEFVPMKPGSATFAVPGVDAAVVDDDGNPVAPGRKGYIVIRKPWPGMLLSLWGDDEKYKTTYWSRFEGRYYYPGDYALVDKDGYLWLLGRADDVLKVAGHRLGTMELESAFVSHKAIAEAAVASRPDATKGESIIAFLVAKAGVTSPPDLLRKEIVEHIRKTVGPIATPDEVYFVDKLPKTRSGKIMRRLLKAVANGDKVGDITTLEDGAAIDEVKRAYDELKNAVG
ncbi:MAG TPA: acetate--CoA ligase [Nitrososphaera sp.]|nr:acetate--CoA ligase [Nitrososphaera sp.]